MEIGVALDVSENSVGPNEEDIKHDDELHAPTSSDMSDTPDTLDTPDTPDTPGTPDTDLPKPEKHIHPLTEIEVVAIISVLEDIYYQLCIVGCPQLKYIEKYSEPLYRTIEERVNTFRVYASDECDELQGEIEDTVPVLRNHLMTNSIRLIKTLDQTICDLVHAGTYEHLQDYVIVPYFVTLEECNLAEVMNERLKEIEEHQKKLKNFYETNASRLAKELCEVQKTKGYFVRVRQFIKKEKSYLDQWETCRRSQLSRRLQMNEERVNKALSKLKKEFNEENYAHAVIMDFLIDSIKSTRLKLREYEYRKFDDMHAVDDKLEIVLFRSRQLKKEVNDSTAKSNHLENKLIKHRRLMMMNKAATTIQNWWRSVQERMKTKRQMEMKKIPGKKKKGKGKGKGKGKEKEEVMQQEKKDSVISKKSLVETLSETKQKKFQIMRKQSRLPSFGGSPGLSYENILKAGHSYFAKPVKDEDTFSVDRSSMDRFSMEPSSLGTSISRTRSQSNFGTSISSTRSSLKTSLTEKGNKLLAGLPAVGGDYLKANRSITVNVATLAKDAKTPLLGKVPAKTDMKPKPARKVREEKTVPKQNVQRRVKKTPPK